MIPAYSEVTLLASYFVMLLGLFLQTLITVVQFFRRKKHAKRMRELLFFVVQFVLTAVATYNLASIDTLGTASGMQLSVWTYPVFLVLLFRSFWVGGKMYDAVHDEITAFSIADSIDALSSGLLFYDTDGQILLENTEMKRIVHDLFGEGYKNGNTLWKDILARAGREETQLPLTVRLTSNQRVYAFLLEEIYAKKHKYLELSVSDVTLVHAHLKLLQEKNRQLADSARDVADMLSKVENTVALKEKLRMKVALHDALGQQYSLMKALIEYADRYDIAPEQLRPLRVLDLLHPDEEVEAEESLESIRTFFRSIGIRIEKHVETELPPGVANTFHLIAIECITNGIIHGNARSFTVAYTQKEGSYHLCVENDGTPARGSIHEGGGIQGMRFRLKPYGGTLQVKEEPFTVIATIPIRHTK